MPVRRRRDKLRDRHGCQISWWVHINTRARARALGVTGLPSSVAPGRGMRADELLADGNVDGAATWRAIIRAIEELQRTRRADETVQ